MNFEDMEGAHDFVADRMWGMIPDVLEDIVDRHEDEIVELLESRGWACVKREELRGEELREAVASGPDVVSGVVSDVDTVEDTKAEFMKGKGKENEKEV